MKAAILLIAVMALATAANGLQTALPADTRIADACSNCITGTEICTREATDVKDPETGQDTRISALCVVNWASEELDFSKLDPALINENIGKISQAALEKNIHQIKDLSALKSENAKKRVAETFRNKYGFDLEIVSSTGPVSLSENGLLKAGGADLDSASVRLNQAITGVKLETVQSGSELQNVIRFSMKDADFLVVGNPKRIGAATGAITVEGLKITPGQGPSQIGVNNGYVTIANAKAESGNDEIFGNAIFYLASDGSLDRQKPISLKGDNSWSCFEAKGKCARGSPAGDSLFDPQPSADTVTLVCAKCPPGYYDEFDTQLQKGEITGYAILGEAPNSRGTASATMRVRGRTLGSFDRTFAEGKDINTLYDLIDEGDSVAVDFKFLGQERTSGQVGRVVSQGKIIDLAFDADGTVHAKYLITPSAAIPIHSAAFLKGLLFNEDGFLANELATYVEGGGEASLEKMQRGIASIPRIQQANPELLQYLKARFPTASEEEIGEHYRRLNYGISDIQEKTGRTPGYDEAFAYSQRKISALARIKTSVEEEERSDSLQLGRLNDASDQILQAYMNPNKPTYLYHESARTTPDGEKIKVQNVYTINQNAVLLTENLNEPDQYEYYRALLNKQYQRNTYARLQSDPAYAGLSEEDKQNAAEGELRLAQGLISAQAQVKAYSNLLDLLEKNRGNVAAIQKIKGLMYAKDEAEAWQMLQQYNSMQKGAETILNLRAKGATLAEIQAGYQSKEVQAAFNEPTMRLLLNEEVILDGLRNGRQTINVNGKDFDISTPEAAATLIALNYEQAARAYASARNYPEANKMALALLRYTMSTEDFDIFAAELAKNSHEFRIDYAGDGSLPVFINAEGKSYAVPRKILELIQQGRLNSEIVSFYINNNAEIQARNALITDPRQIADLILPSEYADIAFNLLPEGKGAGIILALTAKGALKGASNAAIAKVLLKEGARLSSIGLTGFGPSSSKAEGVLARITGCNSCINPKLVFHTAGGGNLGFVPSQLLAADEYQRRAAKIIRDGDMGGLTAEEVYKQLEKLKEDYLALGIKGETSLNLQANLLHDFLSGKIPREELLYRLRHEGLFVAGNNVVVTAGGEFDLGWTLHSIQPDGKLVLRRGDELKIVTREEALMETQPTGRTIFGQGDTVSIQGEAGADSDWTIVRRVSNGFILEKNGARKLVPDADIFNSNGERLVKDVDTRYLDAEKQAAEQAKKESSDEIRRLTEIIKQNPSDAQAKAALEAAQRRLKSAKDFLSQHREDVIRESQQDLNGDIGGKIEEFMGEADTTFSSQSYMARGGYDQKLVQDLYIIPLLRDHRLAVGQTPVYVQEREIKRLAEMIDLLHKDGFSDKDIDYITNTVLFQSKESASTTLANHGINHLLDDYKGIRELTITLFGTEISREMRMALAQGAIFHDIGYTTRIMSDAADSRTHWTELTSAHPQIGGGFLDVPAVRRRLMDMYGNEAKANEMMELVHSMVADHARVSRDFKSLYVQCKKNCNDAEKFETVVRGFGLMDDLSLNKDTELMTDPAVWNLLTRGPDGKLMLDRTSLDKMMAERNCVQRPQEPRCKALASISVATFNFNGPRIATAEDYDASRLVTEGKIYIRYSQDAVDALKRRGIGRSPVYSSGDFECDKKCSDDAAAAIEALKAKRARGEPIRPEEMHIMLGTHKDGIELWTDDPFLDCAQTLLSPVCAQVYGG
ncbi:hypothetical protein HYY74_07070 [Candidatus Woesearchaeota archaeon]|nr:hypothetical protein [Candidatus Woesearchaeota archaeon]